MIQIIEKQRLLIVDDVPINIKTLSDFFKEDYIVCFATSGPDALEMVSSKNPPDLILLDILMPEMNGYDVCKKLKSDDVTKDIPIIFITSKNREEDELKGFEVGAVDYITKPFFMPIVRARVQTQMELKKSRDILENISSIDGLTGIANRKRFNDYLNIEWNRAQRNKIPISLIMTDIDCFKLFNDFYGHPKGDECLVKVADTLRTSVKRPTDLVARYGGEEFVVVLPDTDMTGAFHIGESMRCKVHNLTIPHTGSIVSDCVTISVGVSNITPTEKLSPGMLVEAADKALYEAKRESRNTCRSCLIEDLVKSK